MLLVLLELRTHPKTIDPRIEGKQREVNKLNRFADCVIFLYIFSFDRTEERVEREREGGKEEGEREGQREKGGREREGRWRGEGWILLR